MATITVTRGYNDPTGFTSGETITPAKLNSAQSPTVSISSIVNADIDAAAAIAHSKLATVSSGNVLIGNASNVATSTALTGDITVTSAGVTAIGGGKVTPAMLSGAQTGSAPVFGIRAWANFSGNTSDNLTGTYSQSGTTVTVTATAHGHKVGHKINVDVTSGSGVDGSYVVATVANANTFTYTAGTSLTTSGNITLRRRQIRSSGNISSISYISAQEYALCFTEAMPNTSYAVMGLALATNVASGSATLENPDQSINSKTTMFCHVLAKYSTGSPDAPDANVIVVG